MEAASRPELKLAGSALFSQTPFIEVNVSDALFRGYKDPFLDSVCNIPFMDFVCKQILHLPERIGFFYQVRDSLVILLARPKNLSLKGWAYFERTVLRPCAKNKYCVIKNI